MNKYLLIALLVFAALLSIAGKMLFVQIAETKRLSGNIEAMQLHHNHQQQLTRKELAKYYAGTDSLIQHMGIKIKNVTDIVRVQYRFRDTIIKTSIIDSLTRKFSIQKDCYTITGYVHADTVGATLQSFNDQVTGTLYLEKPKWILGMRKFWKKPTAKAQFYSTCKRDTLEVDLFIKMQR